ncbi:MULTISPECIES: flippase-like domain-containing protein [Micromonospora]|uniref:non-specific serine/threonine protein kinase n=1 Tax=Micromonospora maris TaxID=1003110 RepID=A0A9X0I8X5_9ACTN|nr:MULTISPECIES: flippase-like domain-containing protein [Micromonospora]AEB43831.1 serine/threonine protein kinase [Micromonospora maris AB-18-032]KUJ49088.1 phosphoesterase PA-phosphatase [Micromonospora maris]RUL91956.1 TIGR00374 family protein [Verrucosispora sp. FIM060022]
MLSRTHRPSPALLVSLAVSTVLLVGLGLLVRQHPVAAWERDVFTLLNRLPAGVTPVLIVVMQLGSYLTVFGTAALAAVLRRFAVARDLLLAGNLAYWLAVVNKVAVARQRPGALLADAVLHDRVTGSLGYPSGHVAVATALALVAARAGGTRWRRLLWPAVAVVAVARVHVGAHLPVDAIGGLLVGWLAVCLTRLVVGEVGPQRSTGVLREALRHRGFDVVRLAPLSGDARGSWPWLVVTGDGRRLFVKVTGGQQRDADWAYKLYRRLRYRHVADEPPYLSAKQQSEHETCLTLLAERAGVRVPSVVTTATLPGGEAVLVQEFIDAAPLDATYGPLPTASIADVCRQVALLHRGGIAHRDLRAANILVDRDGAYLVDFGFGVDDAAADQRARDIVELLVALAGRVDPGTAVDVAIAELGVDDIAGSLPYLQPAVLSRASRDLLRHTPDLLEQLRGQIMRRCPQREQRLARVVRITPRGVLLLIALGLLVHLLLPQLGEVRAALRLMLHAHPLALAATLLGSAATYLLSAVVLRLASNNRVPLGEATAVQVAASFANRLAPGSVGGAALSLRYLHQKGLRAAESATAVVVSRVAGVVSVALLLPVLLPFARRPTRAAEQAVTARALPVLLGVLLVLLAVAAVLAVPQLRRRGRAVLRESIAALRALPRRHRLTRLIGAALALTLAYGFSLYFGLLAVGEPIDLALLAPVILVCVVGEGVASAAPTPGGLGATEAALVSGLLLYGVPVDTAVAGVLLYRLATFWLPAPLGYVALRILARQRLV